MRISARARSPRWTPLTAYSLWKLRQDVFVVEQECAYPDLDGRDPEPETRHVVLEDDDGAVLGCARVLDDGDTWRIGRVALHPTVRGQGLADALMETALQVCPDRDVVLDAQAPLAGWYAHARLRGHRAGVPRGRDPAPADAAGDRPVNSQRPVGARRPGGLAAGDEQLEVRLGLHRGHAAG